MSSPIIIKTLKESSINRYKEKGSEFIAEAIPVASEEEIQIRLNEVKKKYYDASHHCYAFRLKDDSFRYSDAGEPNGTAGIRILNAIDHFEVRDILLIVTRYFGGIKLGVGPLGKAYYRSAELLLKGCVYQEERPYRKIKALCGFEYISVVHREISAQSLILENIEYGEKVSFDILVPSENADLFINKLTDSTNGNVRIFTESGIIYNKI
jgi:uncharacterized YigZ family protein